MTDQHHPAFREMERETLRRAQAWNRLAEATAHLSAEEIEMLVASVRAGSWRD